MDDELDFGGNDSNYTLPGNYVTSDEPAPVTTDFSGGDNDSNYTAPGSTTNVDAVNPGGASGSGLQVGVRTGSPETGWQTLNKDGSITYEDPGGGEPYTKNPDGTYTSSSGTFDPKTGNFIDAGGGVNAGITSLVNSAKGFFQKKDAKGNPIPGEYDWAKIAGVGAAAAGALGIGSKKTSGGWEGSIPNYTASREQIKYDDANRRPGSQGRQYFTDVSYSGASTAPQAQGIMAAYQAAQPQQAAPKWNAQNAVATPWAKRPEAAAPVAATPVAPPEETVQAATGGVMPFASGRYLQGSTDGMADEINTSIDNKQPAKLSHGEFVVPADVVSHLGNGNSDAGAKKLYSMMDKVRQARTGTKKQGKQINPDKYMPGGTVNKYAAGGIAGLPVKGFAPGGTTGPATDTTTSSTLSPWAGDYVANYLGKGQALANGPYQTYQGPLTAGPSDLQQQQFAGISNLAQTGLAPTQFSTGTFGTEQAQQYMNPYLKNALDPQLEELRRQSKINLQPNMAKLTQAGGYGGGRQAIMESEANRNLLQEQNKTVGQGYATAYDKAMQQFNAEQQRQLDTQRAQQMANEASATYGLKSLDALGTAGATQRNIEAEGVAADKAQFEEQRDYPYKMVQYQQGLLQGLPISTQTNTQNMSPITSLLSNLGYGGQLYDLLNKYSGTSTTPAATPAATAPASSGVTGGGSSGVTSS
jgi:hypothetical protein